MNINAVLGMILFEIIVAIVIGIIAVIVLLIIKLSKDIKNKKSHQIKKEDIIPNISQNVNNMNQQQNTYQYNEYKNTNPNEINSAQNKEIYPYRKRNLLTKNEYMFYSNLIKIAEKYNLTVLSKIRLADLIEVNTNIVQKNEYMKYFGKIKSKHIDFVVAEKYTLRVIAAIELDDKSHQRQERKERDIFVNNALKIAGIEFIRCYNGYNIEPMIQNIMYKKLNF